MSMHTEAGWSVPRPAVTSSATAAAEQKWTSETVLSVRRWTPALFSFRTTRYQGFRFAPGQFARLGIVLDDGTMVWRAYSIVSASYDEYLEFFSVVVPDGQFTSRLAQYEPGDQLLVEKTSNGFLTTDRFVRGRHLWLLASGTGLAPFLSILRDPLVWSEYEHLILVHSVRHASELAYRDEILALESDELLRNGRTCLRYVPVVTQEAVAGTLSARITRLIEDGRLEAAVGAKLDVDGSRLMICGNPQMAADLRDVLTSRGFCVGRRGNPGQLAFENYW